MYKVHVFQKDHKDLMKNHSFALTFFALIRLNTEFWISACNVCLIKIRSKLSNVSLLCLLKNFMRQTLAPSLYALSQQENANAWKCKLWHYRLWSFQTGGTKLERFLPKNQHTQRKLLSFENWVSGEVSKIEHHFSK